MPRGNVNHGFPTQAVHMTDGHGRSKCKGSANYPEVTTDPEKVTCRNCKGEKLGGRPRNTKTQHS